MTPLEQLKAARELISEPERWTQGGWAREGWGFGKLACDPEAVCFCAEGALIRCDANAVAFSALGRAMGDAITYFNDTHTHAEVLAAFDKAIASLEAA